VIVAGAFLFVLACLASPARQTIIEIVRIVWFYVWDARG